MYNARTNGDINKSDMKYDVKGKMWLYQIQRPWVETQSENNIMRQDSTNSYSEKNIVPDTIYTWHPSPVTGGWPNMLPFDLLFPSLAFKKTLEKSNIAYFTKNILRIEPTTKLSNYLNAYSWAHGFPMWNCVHDGTLSFKPQFTNNSDTYLMWCLNGPSDSNEPYSVAPTNYYIKSNKCSLTQRTSGNGKGAFECKSGDNIVIDGVKEDDIVYLYFTTIDGKAGAVLNNNIQATFESNN